MNKLANSRRVLILLLGMALIFMLGTSLYKRFTQPELTVGTHVAEAPEASDKLADLMRKVAENPNDKDTIIHLVEALMSLGEWASAENFAQKALSLDGATDASDPRPLYLLALIHHNQGHNAQAAELLEKLLEKTELPQARYSLAILYLHFLNNPRLGIENLQKGLAGTETPAALKSAMREELQKAAGFMEKREAMPREDEKSIEELENETESAFEKKESSGMITK